MDCKYEVSCWVRLILGFSLSFVVTFNTSAWSSERSWVLSKQDTTGRGAQEQPGGVVGGQDVQVFNIPWQVYFGDCGGSIISEDWIVTAAHCEPNIGEIIYAGVSSGLNLSVGQRRTITQVISHPDWNGFSQDGADIALVKVDSPFDFSDLNVQPIRYATNKDEQDGLMSPCVVGTVSGWGRLSFNGSFSNESLQVVRVPIVSNDLADDAYIGTFGLADGWITADQLAAGDFSPQGCTFGDQDGGEDACEGDSGGPFTVKDADGIDDVLAGVVSWGFECANPGFPGMYARVSSFENFIFSNTGVYNNQYPRLIIKEIVDGTNAGEAPRYIEIYNASEVISYNLDNISLLVYKDGSETPEAYEIPDGRELMPQETLVIASTNAWETEWGGRFATETPDLTTTVISGDGNDAYAIYDEQKNTVLDVFGIIGEDGSDTFWEYEDAIVFRKDWVSTANDGNFVKSREEWEIIPYQNTSASPGDAIFIANDDDLLIAEADTSNVVKAIGICDGDFEVNPEFKIRNVGLEVVTNARIRLNGGRVTRIDTLSFDPPLLPGASTIIETDPISLNEPENISLEIEIIDLLGKDDQGKSDNLTTFSINVLNGVEAVLEIDFDNKPEEQGWDLKDNSGNVISSIDFGFYQGFENSSVLQNLCLYEGCFELVLKDEGADGGSTAALEIADDIIVANIAESNWGVQQILSFCILPKPGNFIGQPVSTSSVQLTWESMEGIEGFKLQRSEGSSELWEEIATLSSDANSYVDTELTPKVGYQYRIRAYNTNSSSIWAFTEGGITVVGLNGQLVKSKQILRISPNPAISGNVLLYSEEVWTGNIEVTLLDVMGRQKDSYHVKRLSPDSGLTLDVNDLNQGVYIIQAKSSGKQSMGRLVIR